jgi:hypothetical protein
LGHPPVTRTGVKECVTVKARLSNSASGISNPALWSNTELQQLARSFRRHHPFQHGSTQGISCAAVITESISIKSRHTCHSHSASPVRYSFAGIQTRMV